MKKNKMEKEVKDGREEKRGEEGKEKKKRRMVGGGKRKIHQKEEKMGDK